MSSKECDNKSVGVIVQDTVGNTLLLSRAKYPFGWAAPAGHIDDHGSPEQAAVNEVHEEVGIILPIGGLIRVVDSRRIDNKCSRIGGDYHEWTVYKTVTETETITPSADETRGARWFSEFAINDLIARSELSISESTPGQYVIEPIWVEFLREAEVI